jgi:hypothetical protein
MGQNRTTRVPAGRFWLVGLLLGLLVGGAVGFMLTHDTGSAIAAPFLKQ